MPKGLRLVRSEATMPMLVALGLLTGACSSPSADLGSRAPETTNVAPAVDDGQLVEWRASIAGMWSIEQPPIVEIIARLPQGEAQPLVESCLAERGFPKAPDGSWVYPSEQTDVFNLAQYTCTVQYPPRAEAFQPLTDLQKERVYKYVAETLLPCLAAEGYVIGGLPSQEVFVANFDSNPYFPYAQVDQQVLPQNQNNSYMDALYQRCPQDAPYQLIYAQ